MQRNDLLSPSSDSKIMNFLDDSLEESQEEKSQTRASTLLHLCYLKDSSGKVIDETTTVEEYKKSAVVRPASAFLLGLCYELGYGVNKDNAVAQNWYKHSAVIIWFFISIFFYLFCIFRKKTRRKISSS